MIITIKVKLDLNKEQHKLVELTLKQVNAACNDISQVAFTENIFNQFRLHHQVYYQIRDKFSLPANHTIRAISKVIDAYKSDKRTLHTFSKTSAIDLDARLFNINTKEQKVNITLLNKRITTRFLCAKAQYEVLQGASIKQSKLCVANKKAYLLLSIEVPDEQSYLIEGVIGIDLGIVNIITTSDGTILSGQHLNNTRFKYQLKRSSLQKKGSHAAKRKLRKISKRESNFVKDVNHCLSKKLILQAVSERKALALEDLKGIRDTQVNRFRRSLQSWAFYQLRSFIEYKAKLYGVPIILVAPHYTSQRCSVCGYTNKDNRTTQDSFKCLACNHTEHADINAAKNIAHKAMRADLSTRPLCSTDDFLSG